MAKDRSRRSYRLDCPDIDNFAYLGVGGEAPVKKLTVGGEDISSFVIFLGEGAGESGEYAAQELARYISLVCGVTLERGGEDAEYKIALLPDEDESFEKEGYIIDNDGKTLTIRGGMPRGVLYGVYEFLERCVGVRFFAADTEICYKRDELDIPTGRLDEEYPAIEYRDVYTPATYNADFAAKRKINSYYSRDFTAKHGGCISYTGRFVHTMETYLGTPQTEQPCFSDEGNLEKVIEGVRALLREHPDARFISVTQNDIAKPCTCEKCKKVDAEEESHAGSMLRFVNAVADAVKDEFPDTLIITLAYQHTAKPPKITRPRDNVIVQFCPIEECCVHSIDDPACERNADFVRSFTEWRKIPGLRLYVWDYFVNFGFMIPPFPNLHAIRRNLRFYADYDMVGIFAECDNSVPNQKVGEFGNLRAYIVSRMCWNPYMTDEEVERDIREFAAAYYGDVDEICEYIKLTEECCKHNHFDCFANPLHLFYLPALRDALPRMEELWKKILADAEGTPRYEHAEIASLQHEYIMLLRCFDDVMQSGSDDEKVEMIGRNRKFYDNLKKYNLRQSLHRKLPQITDFSKSVIAYMFEEGKLVYENYDPFLGIE